MPPSPLPAPPRRRGFFVVILVSVTVPMVGSVAVGLVFFSGLYPGLSPCVVNFKPAVTLGAASSVGDGERIPVLKVIPNCMQPLPSDFRVNLETNTTWGFAAPVLPNVGGVAVTVTYASGLNYSVTWTDANPDRNLTAGDYFSIACPAGFPPRDNYTFALLWQDGSILTTVPFQR